ncbi:efflux RND transporter permease subunit [Phaeodactylibacter sp.]|jgi:multidrug efflux pump|uniref:efflux RND transporter permease subunit n=1 Tax=Phaeodactylibacter sp. TaxID=1940289 RepID=UPI0025F4605B|nr:efflux RND transporter permease subunit [Phaeodactylibacter sp.]MCI4650883.1 efflux RND transporter permease subunit [Phaeodactylibacter sp.]MCI5089840.1 efflux RND transporter permease subunit [Phaeodactylibacter sp.]
MSLSSLSIKRPVLASVLSIVIVLFGLIGLTYLGVREYPSVDPPIITVTTNYVGANADIIESQITEPVEEAVNGIAGIRSITSVSRDGRSTLTVEFDLEVDLETAANDVRDKVSQVVGELPPDTDPPVVSKADADSDPIIFLNIQSDQRSLLELTDIAENVFKERLQTINGVSEIRIWGQKKYAMRLWIEAERLAAYGLTPLDVQQALQRENIELPSGRVEGANTELTVRTQGRLTTPDEFNNLILKEENGRIVRFRDIGYAELGPENLRTVLKRDGVPMVGNAIVPQPGANNIEIADAFYERLEQIKKDLPADIQLGIGFDKTQFIRDSIDEVEQTIYVAFGLVVMIIFLFLRDWRTTIIPVIVIPIALIGAFFVMYAANFSINVLTLLGIVLAIGLVVDDAVVVLENIYTKVENGMTPLEAAMKGSEEIFFAVIATTVALVAVFMPVIFLQGLTGRLFREFGIVIAGAVVISSFVALTLTPMLSSSILKKRERQPWFYRVTEPFFVALTKGYRSTLNGFMQVRWLALVIMAISGWAIYAIGGGLPQELAPLEDRSRIRAFARAPEGSTFEYMDAYTNDLVETMVEAIPESEGVISVTSPGFGASTSVNSAFAFAVLEDPQKRERSQTEILNAIRPEVSELTGALTYLSEEQSIGNGRGGLPVQYVLQAPNFEKLKETLPRFVEKVKQDPTFSFVDVDLKFNKPELNIEINRQKARDLGVSVLDIAQTLQLGLSGQRFGYFIMNGKQYQVIGQIQREGRDEPVDLRSLYVRNDAGNMVQLDNLVTLEEQITPPTLFRFNRFASATVSAGLSGDNTLGNGIEAMNRIAAETLDDGFYTTLTGTSRDFAESSSSLVFAFALALVLIYLVLAAQFESFIDPFIIMFTVPLALAGAVLSLMLYGQTLNIFSQIGIIMLIGLVAKNGILIVEFANQRKEAGLSRLEAIKEAAEARFRPILMTSLSTILGVLPIALALGAGSESRVSMGIAVIGGLVFSTVLTLYVIPAIYSYLSSKEAKRTKREEQLKALEEA